MTIRVGDTVRCPSISSANSFPGTAIVRYLDWREGATRRMGDVRIDDWLQVERADGQAGGGVMYMGITLWVIHKRYVVKVAPRSINYPPTRYGPYVPIPKALP